MFSTKKSLINDCYQRSIDLLVANSGEYGIKACASSKRAIDKRYDYIFGRDGSICALGMIASKDKRLLKTAKRSLMTLAEQQTFKGQIPFSAQPAIKKNIFWYLGSIDSTLWWLIALDFYNRYSGDDALYKKYEIKIKRALRWLSHQDQNDCGMLEQCEASDWADNMPFSGRVLYTNVLWYKVLGLYGLKKEKELVCDGLNNLFLPHEANPNRSEYLGREIHRLKELRIIQEQVEQFPYYLNFVGHKYACDRFDVYGNSLAILFGISNQARSQAIIRYARNQGVNKKYPVQVFTPPITERDYDWRDYMEEENKPFNYHNGGIWPYVGGFWVMALFRAGKKDLAYDELANLAKVNKVNNWSFNEWFHGKKGKPMGMDKQSWNAGTFLLAYHYLNNEIEL